MGVGVKCAGVLGEEERERSFGGPFLGINNVFV